MSVMWYIAYTGMRIVAKNDRDGYNRDGHPDEGTQGTCVQPTRWIDYVPRWGIRAGTVPGRYEKDGCWLVRWDGAEQDVLVDTYNCDVAPESKDHYDMRRQAFWVSPVIEKKFNNYYNQTAYLEHHIRRGYLPPTKFWECDIVAPNGTGHVFHGDNVAQRIILSIDYRWRLGDHKHHRNQDGYNISWYTSEGEDAHQGSSFAWDSDMELVERGNLWKYYHKQPLFFRSIKEEISFAHGIGHYSEVRNPENGLFKWDKDSALQAVKDGIADHFSLSPGLFGGTTRESVFRCTDIELGERVRKLTLDGFGIAA